MAKSEKTVSIGSFSFDLENGILTDPNAEKVNLRPQTTQVLARLASAPGQLVTKDALMSAIWADTHVTDDSLVQCISEIRRALGRENARRLVTVPKQGYRLDAQPGGEATVESSPSAELKRSRWRRPAISAAAAMLVAAVTILAMSTFDFTGQGGSTAGEARVAVLPFENLSGDSDQDYLSVGLAEDLMTDLSRSSDLSVLSRSATFGYRDGNNDPAARLHRDLDATHVVDGSLQKDGERIRISVQLVDAATGSSIWAERFDRRIEGLFELQDEVRLRILEALSAELPFDSRETHTTGTTDVSAYDLLLQGRYLEASDTRKNTLEAIRLYKRAIDVDPSYSDAYARLSNMYELSSRSGWSISPEGDRALALEMAERAVRLDPDNPFAHWTRGRVISRLDDGGDATKRAVAALNKALELEPDYSDAYAYLALVYIGVGQNEEAVDAIATAFRINPEPRSWYFRNRGVISYFHGEYEAAIEDFERASEINSIAHASRTWMAAALAKVGRTEDAEWEMAESIVAGVPDSAAKFLDSHGFIKDPAFRAALFSGLYAAGMVE